MQNATIPLLPMQPLTITLQFESRRIPIPPHRLTPLKKDWLKIITPLVEHLHLQVRMNIKSKSVEIRTCHETVDQGTLTTQMKQINPTRTIIFIYTYILYL